MLEATLIAALGGLAEARSPLEVERNRGRAARVLGDSAPAALTQLLDTLATNSLERCELSRLATEDALTGLANRRCFERALGRELARRQRLAGPAVLLVDLDGLKQINDTHGHAAGDEAIRRAARACAAFIRGGDLAARLGGDELAILLPDTDRTGAEQAARRVCAAIEAEVVEGSRLGASLGIAIAGPDGDTESTLLAVADQRMYAQKRRRKPRLVA